MLMNFTNYWEFFLFIITFTMIEAAVRQAHPNFYFRSGISIYRYEYAWPFSLQMYAVANKLTAIEKSQLTDSDFKAKLRQIGEHAFGLEAFNMQKRASQRTSPSGTFTLTHAYIKIDKNNQRVKLSIKLNWGTVPVVIFFLGSIISFFPLVIQLIFLSFLIFVMTSQLFQEWELYLYFRDELKLWKMT